MADDATETRPGPTAAGGDAAGHAHGLITHKLGPLPVWAWVAIGSVGVLLVLHARGKKSSPSKGQGAGAAGVPALSDVALSNMALGQSVQSLGQSVASLGQGINGLSSFAGAIAVPTTQPAGTVPATPAAAAPAGVSGPSYSRIGDPGWAAGLGEIYVNAWDFYGPGKGVGANQVAAYVNQTTPGAGLTPAQVTAWNSGQSFFGGPGQPSRAYVGSFTGGPGH